MLCVLNHNVSAIIKHIDNGKRGVVVVECSDNNSPLHNARTDARGTLHNARRNIRGINSINGKLPAPAVQSIYYRFDIAFVIKYSHGKRISPAVQYIHCTINIAFNTKCLHGKAPAPAVA